MIVVVIESLLFSNFHGILVVPGGVVFFNPTSYGLNAVIAFGSHVVTSPLGFVYFLFVNQVIVGVEKLIAHNVSIFSKFNDLGGVAAVRIGKRVALIVAHKNPAASGGYRYAENGEVVSPGGGGYFLFE